MESLINSDHMADLDYELNRVDRPIQMTKNTIFDCTNQIISFSLTRNYRSDKYKAAAPCYLYIQTRST